LWDLTQTKNFSSRIVLLQKTISGTCISKKDTSNKMDPIRAVEDERSNDLLILSAWVKKELFIQVKFLYELDEERGKQVSIVEDTPANHFGIMQPERKETW
jgi:hypothetical protein